MKGLTLLVDCIPEHKIHVSPAANFTANNVEEVLSLQPMFPPKPLDIFPPEGGCSEGLDAFRFKRFCLYSQCSHLTKPLDIFPPEGGCSEGLDAFRFFLNTQVRCTAGLNAPPLRTSHRRVIARSSLCVRSLCSGWDEQPRTSGRTRVQGVAKQGIIGPE